MKEFMVVNFFLGGHIPWTRGQLRQGFRLITAAPWIKEMVPRENGLNSQPQKTPCIVGMVWEVLKFVFVCFAS